MGRPETKWGVGTCFDCGRDIAMKTDGRLRRHGPLEQTCGGSGSVPVSYEQILLAAVREGVESGTIEGEVAVICTTHGAKAYKGDPGEWRLCLYAADRGWGNCRLEPHLVIGPVSDGGEDRP